MKGTAAVMTDTPKTDSAPLKRAVDIAASLGGLVAAFIPMLVIAAIVRGTSKGPALHWSRRVGRGNSHFWMPKFRSMRTDTPDTATHLLQDPAQWITPIGRVLRKTSLDELPQLYSVLVGDMSLVGPRPALHSQDDLVAMRTKRGVHSLRPGITGWAQINGRDEIPLDRKVDLDAEYLTRRSVPFDVVIIYRTVAQAFSGKGVSH